MMKGTTYNWCVVKRGKDGLCYLGKWSRHYLGHAGEEEVYISYFVFNDVGARWIVENNYSLRGIGLSKIPVYTNYLLVDIDRQSLDTAWSDTRWLAGRLTYIYDVPVHVWFSGNKGFHITVPISELGTRCVPSVGLPRKLSKVVSAITTDDIGNQLEYDSMIYQTSRFVRLPYTRHGESGLYKIPVSVSDSLDSIIERAHEPRRDIQ